jgi:tetratricopeptide (TPR) repeat protein
MALEKQSKHDEAAATLLKPAKAYASEELAASIHLRGCWNLSKAKSDQFETESTIHFKRWPNSETSNQARYWVASLQTGRGDHKSAFQTLLKTQPQSSSFPASVKLARSAARRQLASLEKKGLATRSLARQLLQSWTDIYSSCPDSSRPLVAVAMAELCLAWRAEDSNKSADRLNAAAQLQAAESNAEFQYLLAVLGGLEEKDLRISKANAAPFEDRAIAQLLRSLNRIDDSKRVSETKLAIADNAIAKTKDSKRKNQFLLARAVALTELGKEIEAQAIFKQLMDSDSNNLNVLLGMARVSKGESALKLWRSIGSRTKKQTSAWFEAKYNVAKLLHESGKSSEAAKMLKYIKAVPPGWENSPLKGKFERLLRESSG